MQFQKPAERCFLDFQFDDDLVAQVVVAQSDCIRKSIKLRKFCEARRVESLSICQSDPSVAIKQLKWSDSIIDFSSARVISLLHDCLVAGPAVYKEVQTIYHCLGSRVGSERDWFQFISGFTFLLPWTQGLM